MYWERRERLRKGGKEEGRRKELVGLQRDKEEGEGAGAMVTIRLLSIA